MDLIGVTLAGEALVLLLLAVHFRSSFTCYISLAFVSIAIPFILVGA